MTTPNVFPPDILQDIRDAKTTGQQSQAAAARRAPLTKASKGWRLSGDAPPEPGDLDPGEVHIRGEDGALVVRSGDGDITVREFAPGGPVDDATVSLFNAPATYTPAQIQTYTDSMQSLADSHQELLDKLRAAGIILT